MFVYAASRLNAHAGLSHPYFLAFYDDKFSKPCIGAEIIPFLFLKSRRGKALAVVNVLHPTR